MFQICDSESPRMFLAQAESATAQPPPAASCEMTFDTALALIASGSSFEREEVQEGLAGQHM